MIGSSKLRKCKKTHSLGESKFHFEDNCELTIENDLDADVIFFVVDKCLLPPKKNKTEKRCDLLYCIAFQEKGLYVELKGSDLTTAYMQVYRAAELCQTSFGFKVSHGLIVHRVNPVVNNSVVVKIKRHFREKFGGTIRAYPSPHTTTLSECLRQL